MYHYDGYNSDAYRCQRRSLFVTGIERSNTNDQKIEICFPRAQLAMMSFSQGVLLSSLCCIADSALCFL